MLHGKRLQGSFVLVRMRHDRDGGKRTSWLLISTMTTIPSRRTARLARTITIRSPHF